MKQLFAIIFSLFIVTTAHAQGYVAGSLGLSKVRDACDGFGAAGVTCDDSDISWKVSLGYQINPSFAVEVGYADLGKAKASGPGGTAELKANVFEVVAIGSAPIAGNFSAFGKFGFYRGDSTGSIDTVTVVGSASDTNTDVTLGLGGRYDINEKLAVRAEWQRYLNVGGDNLGKSDVDILGASLILKF
ncbi:MAG: outer membrane beta-barrel protein [Burkholderiales bacterium]